MARPSERLFHVPACVPFRGPDPLCFECGVDTIAIGEWYMVRDNVWLAAVPWDARRARGRRARGSTFLCIGCLEARLGRRLAPGDFMYLPINEPAGASPRLRERLLSCPNCSRDFLSKNQGRPQEPA
jgi:hypothetical protein